MTKQKPQKDKRFQNLLQTTKQFMQGKNFAPLTMRELMKKLHLPDAHKPTFKKILKELIEQEITRFFRGRYHPIKENVTTITGTLSLHKRGFGFVKPDTPNPYDEDVFIPKPFTLNAVDKDRVEVEVNPATFSDKGPEGKVITILKRSKTHVAGIISEIEWHGAPLAYVPLLGTNQRVVIEYSEDSPPLHVGDRVIMEVLDWGTKNTETVCRVTHFIGHISDPSCDITAAVEEFNIKDTFPSAVLKEAEAFGTKVSTKEIGHREDLREIETVTIDPDTAKDFDDALSLRKDQKGHYHLIVHIADVSHYVKKGTALDMEAQERSNSTYFPAQCIPMLPPSLSENLCSLRPNVNRLTISVFMEFDKTGSLIAKRVGRGVIKSNKRFTYKEALQVIEGKKKSPHSKLLQLMVELCGHLKQKRFERGSIEFSLPETVLHVDEKGAPIKTEKIFYDITHQLVEEFMLKANEVIATYLSEQGLDLTYRIHEEPASENMKDFVTLAQAFGFTIPNQPTPQDLQTLFDEALQTTHGAFLATSYIRRMRLAMYSPQNIGHYGLGLSHYCHFTSPIRRYSDLVIHRILFENPVEYQALEKISHGCSEQERVSERAEQSVTLLKKLRLIKALQEQNPRQQFEAIVTRVRNFGVTFEVGDLMLEGYFHLSELDDDFYRYDEKKGQLQGRYSGKTYFAGDPITVMVKEIDLIFQKAQWSLVSDGTDQPRKKRKKQKQSRQRKR